MQSPVNNPCSLCGRATSQWCSRCQKAWYCCPEHLKQHWPTHRNHCIPVTSQNPVPSGYTVNMIATPPPAELELSTITAVYFNPSEERPRVIDVDCKPSHKPSQGMCPLPLIGDYFPDGPCEGIVLTQGLNGEPLRFPLHLWYCPESLRKNSAPNRAINHVTSSAARKVWCGPVIVLKFSGSRRQGYTDAGTNDLPALSAYFLAYK